MKIGFLFNHYMGHQVLHSAPIAFALSIKYPQVDVSIMVSDKNQLEVVRRVEKRWPSHNCEIKMARVPGYVNVLETIARRFAFVRKYFVLKHNKNYFKNLDVLVVPEVTSRKLKHEPGLEHLKIVLVPHGAGDRAVGFSKEFKEFDLLLVAGQKIFDRLANETGVDQKKMVITGYPKFDVIGHRKHEPIFDNENPTVLYNPHFQQGLSSFQEWGRDVLDFFVKNPQYNVIFAPHVILYLRKWRHKAFNVDKYKKYPNIHIDEGSGRSIDMTYSEQADIYLGDVSSQVYEFLTVLRPCVFLNPHKFNWQNDPSFTHWKFGPVIENISQLGAVLDEAKSGHKRTYRAVQKELFNHTFSLSETPSSYQAADALVAHFATPQKAIASNA